MALIGKPLPRVEDRRLLTGRGTYTADWDGQGAAWAVLLRSPHAHARFGTIDIRAARAAPGVLAVLTGADYAAAGFNPIRHTPVPADAIDAAMPAFRPEAGAFVFDSGQWPLALGRVRHVGEGVALVVAETLGAARDAAELIDPDYDPLPAVVLPQDAVAPGAPQLWDGAPGNVCLEQHHGDAAATEDAFAKAAHVVAHDFANQRIVVCHMEPRAVLGSHEDGRFRLVTGSQGAVRHRMDLAKALNIPLSALEVITPDTGGGFGARTNIHPEAVLVLWAAKLLNRPVRWTSTRAEAFVTDFAGRDLHTRAALAFDEEGRILALRTELLGNTGAHTVSFVPLNNGYRIASTVYRVPVASARLRAVVTNTTATAPFRGAGRPEATFAIERLLDIAARRLGIDRIEIRRRNLVPKAALPYRNPFGLIYDSGDFAANMAAALDRADWHGFDARCRASAAAGKLRGIGLANYVESPVGAPREKVTIRLLGEGRVEVLAGTQSTGQGHATSFAQVVADRLGLPMEAITLVTGDTRRIDLGGGSHSDRSMRLAGTLLVEASAGLLDEARRLAAARFGCAAEAVTMEGGLARHAESNATFSLYDLAAAQPGGAIERAASFNGRMPAYPTGCAVCELEVTPDTGEVTICRYTSIDDVGQAINPLIVDGQVHGGIVQGLGQALHERPIFDPESGQPVAGSFMDYGMPRAGDVPDFDVALTEDPTAGNPLRVKGGGESGITPASVAVINALVDALSPFGIEHLPMPATPEVIWRAIAEASAGQRQLEPGRTS